MKGFAHFIETQELAQELLKMGLNPSNYDLDRMINEVDWKKAIATGVLAVAPFISGAKHKEIPDKQPQPYTYSIQRSYEDELSIKAKQDDKKYLAAGGPRFEGSVPGANQFVKFRKSGAHRDIIEKAGLDADYIPSNVKEFVFGSKIQSVHKHSETSGRIEDFKSGVVKTLGRDSFVEIIKSEKLKNGGSFISANISGVIMAMDQQDAERRVESQIENIIRANGFDLNGMSVKVYREFKHVEPAPRSTIDYTQAREWYTESNGVNKFKYNVSVSFTIKPN